MYYRIARVYHAYSKIKTATLTLHYWTYEMPSLDNTIYSSIYHYNVHHI